MQRLGQACALALALVAGLLVDRRYESLKGQAATVASIEHDLDAVNSLSARLRDFRDRGMARHITAWIAACVGRPGDDRARAEGAAAYRADVDCIREQTAALEENVWPRLLLPGARLPEFLRTLDDHLTAEIPPDAGWGCADLQVVDRLAGLREALGTYATCLNELSRIDPVEVLRGRAAFDPCTRQLVLVKFPDRLLLEQADALRAHTFAERAVPLAGFAPGDEIVSRRRGRWTTPTFVVSPDGARVASVVRRDGREFVLTDGEPGPAYDHIAAGRDGAPTFSADSAHLAYCGQRDAKWFVVADGVEGPAWDAVRSLALAPAGGRIAYAGRHGGTWRLVLDGREHPSPLGVPRNPRFSADGVRLAYIVGRDRERVVLDGVPGAPFGRIVSPGLVFSPNSARTAYVAVTPVGKTAVVDGNPGPFYDDVGVPVFSPDSTRVAYLGKRDGVARVIVDGREGTAETAGDGEGPVFSPDSAHVAYVVRNRERAVVIVDGRQRTPYPYPGIRGGVVFSPDSRRVAFVVHRNAQEFVVVDGLAHEQSYAVDERTIGFSPDSKHVAYAAWKSGWRLVVDGAKSSHRLSAVAERPPRFVSPTRVEGVAQEAGPGLVRLELDLPTQFAVHTWSSTSGVGAPR